MPDAAPLCHAGNFKTLQQAIGEYSSDAMRIALADAGAAMRGHARGREAGGHAQRKRGSGAGACLHHGTANGWLVDAAFHVQ